MCSGDELYCFIKVEINGTLYEGFCDTIDEWLVFDEPVFEECLDGEVRETVTEGDCKALLEMEGLFVDGLEWCEYSAVIDSCSGSEISCNATAKVDNEILEGSCEEL